MISFPNAKINLGLNVLKRRADGFHELETVFYPVNWTDSLELITAGNSSFEMTFSGLAVPGTLQNNLCYKAFELIKKDHSLPNLQAHLHKVIPMGAGLGGGSSDAAFMLKMINNVCHLNLSNAVLRNYAAQLGSDCAFFIENKPLLAKGRGEIFEPIEIDLKEYYMVIIMPELTVGTAEAYSWISPKVPEYSLRSVLDKPVSSWKNSLINYFEKPVFEKNPLIAEIKNMLYENGAIYSSMSGSGAAVFALFEESPQLNLKPEWKIFSEKISA